MSDIPAKKTVAAWREQQERFRRFEAWELQQLRERPMDFERTLQWMSEGWELAREHDPEWGSPENARQHWSHLVEIHRRLTRAFSAP